MLNLRIGCGSCSRPRLSDPISSRTDDIDYVELGEIVGVWGVQGWVKVHSYTAHRGDILNHEAWFLGPERRRRSLLEGREQGARILAKLEGLSDRDDAARHVGQTVWVPASAMPKLAEGEYYWTQLEGLEAVSASGVKLGVVQHLFETGANDVLVIRKGDREILVPYVSGVVRRVDLDGGRIELDWESED